MPLPLDLERLAVRIETLQRASTQGWLPADDLEFRSFLPGGRGRRVLPSPQWLRDLAKQFPFPDDERALVNGEWRNWIAWALRAEGLVHDNRPNNPKRIMRDMARGKFPR